MQTQSPEINSLLEALSKAQAKIEGAKMDASNPFFKSKYADLSSVWSAARDPLTENGLCVIQSVEVIETGQTCLCTLLGHKSGQWIKSLIPMKPLKDDPQTMGSLITYYRRYTLAAIVGISPEDDDGEQASQSYREYQPKRNADVAPAPVPKKEKVAKPEEAKKEEMPSIDPLLTAIQCENLDRMIGEDYAYKNAMLKHCQVEFIEEIPQSKYSYLFDRVKAYVEGKEAKKNASKGPSVFEGSKIQELKL